MPAVGCWHSSAACSCAPVPYSCAALARKCSNGLDSARLVTAQQQQLDETVLISSSGAANSTGAAAGGLGWVQALLPPVRCSHSKGLQQRHPQAAQIAIFQ